MENLKTASVGHVTSFTKDNLAFQNGPGIYNACYILKHLCETFTPKTYN